MSQNVHPSAIIDKKSSIGKNVHIGPYCVVGPDVVIEDNITLHSHVVINGRTHIGEGSEIYPFASIGMDPQDLKFHGEPSTLEIGNNNVIREYVTIHPGTESGAMKTVIGDNNLFMIGVHIAHDSVIGNNIVMANNATLGGHVEVGDHVVIGGMCAVHQFVRIGNHAVIGGMSGVGNDVIPFGRVKGERAFLAGLNLIGLERRGFEKNEIRTLQRAFNQLFGNEGTLEQRIDSVEQDFADQKLVMDIVQFAKEKTRFPLCQPPKKAA